jgi:hypothetical protein
MEPIINKPKSRFKMPPTHLNQVDGSFWIKLKAPVITPAKQKITKDPIIMSINGVGKLPLTEMVLGMLRSKQINNPKVRRDAIKDRVENRF